ncbi:Glutamyl-tRNA(Gln) amidotransferase subunit A [compost metagenome]
MRRTKRTDSLRYRRFWINYMAKGDDILSLFQYRLSELHNMLHDSKISVSELTEESLSAVARLDGDIHAFLTLNEEGAKSAARQLDDKLASGAPRGLLFGIPAGVKDNIVTKGLRTTCASRFLDNYQPIYDATVAAKLRQADAVTIGKLNMDEFAMGGSNENSAYGAVRNPWDLERVPGGSSGGSAAAVAAGEVFFALGSDTGGSIRQPASYCGVVGLKPTYGLVSRYGLVAFASSLDQIGPLTRTVEDSAYVLQAIAGYDPQDSTSAKVDIPDYLGALTGDVKGLRIAVPKEYVGEGVDASVRDTVLAALKVLEDLGAVWEEVSLPHTEYAVATYYLLASSEASSNLARFDGVRFGVRVDDGSGLLDLYHNSRSQGFGPEVKRRIMLGTYALSSGYYDAYYLKAQKVRTLIKQDFDEVFKKYDVVIGPTAPTTAFKLGSQTEDPLTMYLNDILTIPVNLAGIPAVSIPCGFAEGLPVGLQIIGKEFDESTVLRVAHAYEQHTDHHKQRPQL